MTKPTEESPFLNQEPPVSIGEATLTDEECDDQQHAEDHLEQGLKEVAAQNAEAAQSQLPTTEDIKNWEEEDKEGPLASPESLVLEGIECAHLWADGKTPSEAGVREYIAQEKAKIAESEKEPPLPATGTPLDRQKFLDLSEDTPRATFCGHCTTKGHAIYSYKGKDYKREDIPEGVAIEPIVAS